MSPLSEEGGPESEFSGLMSSTVGADSGRKTLSELRRYRSAASAAAAAAASAASVEGWGGGGGRAVWAAAAAAATDVGWPLRWFE